MAKHDNTTILIYLDRVGIVLGSCWDRVGIVLGSCGYRVSDNCFEIRSKASGTV